MHTKKAFNTQVIQKLRQILGSVGTGAGNLLRKAVASNPQAASGARSLVDDIYNVYNPKSREILKSFMGDRLNSLRNSTLVQKLPDRYRKYIDNFAGKELKHYGNKLDKGLQKFNKNIYNSVSGFLTPAQQAASAKVGFVKRAVERGFTVEDACILFEKTNKHASDLPRLGNG